jgi:hypothetical protein
LALAEQAVLVLMTVFRVITQYFLQSLQQVADLVDSIYLLAEQAALAVAVATQARLVVVVTKAAFHP